MILIIESFREFMHQSLERIIHSHFSLVSVLDKISSEGFKESFKAYQKILFCQTEKETGKRRDSQQHIGGKRVCYLNKQSNYTQVVRRV
jgi:hypothetical protein